MHGMLVVAGLFLVLASPTIGIAALVIALRTHARLRRLEGRSGAAHVPASAAAAARPIARAQAPAAAPEQGSTAPSPSTPPPAPPPLPPPVPRRPGGALSMEQLLGGHAAGIVGIAVLVTGIVLLVIYAIQNAWLGPGPRVVLGLVSSGVLVGLGHLAERRSRRLHWFARLLTGGGASLFYFSVFAAYRFYELIGRGPCAAGLVLSALAVLGLAWAYRSQLVAILGVLGAFLPPLILGRGDDADTFTMLYVALVNLPVLGLALKRNWQALYNLAFAFTALYLFAAWDWLTAEETVGPSLALAVLYFLQFAGVGLLKLCREERVLGRTLDLVRLSLNSLLLMGLLYAVLGETGLARWRGAAFLAAAAVHVLLARASWHWRPAFRRETLTLLIGGLSFATLALPVQLDGAWVCVGWSLEGLILAWFALRVKSRTLQAGAVFLGLMGIGKALLHDVALYDSVPGLFLNARFVAGALSALLLGGQAFLHARQARSSPRQRRPGVEAFLLGAALLGMVVVLFADAFWTLGPGEPWAWAFTTAVLLAAAVAAAFLAARGAPCAGLAMALLLAIPAKILLLDIPICYFELLPPGSDVFLLQVFWLQALTVLALLALARWVSQPGSSLPLAGKGVLIYLTALVSGIALVSAEFFRAQATWSGPAITLWWTCCALALVGWGFACRRGAFRYAGLAFTGLATAKLLLVDLAGLRGMARIATFLGAGVLLLLLSFVYQQISGRFLAEPASSDAESPEEGS